MPGTEQIVSHLSGIFAYFNGTQVSIYISENFTASNDFITFYRTYSDFDVCFAYTVEKALKTCFYVFFANGSPDSSIIFS